MKLSDLKRLLENAKYKTELKAGMLIVNGQVMLLFAIPCMPSRCAVLSCWHACCCIWMHAGVYGMLAYMLLYMLPYILLYMLLYILLYMLPHIYVGGQCVGVW